MPTINHLKNRDAQQRTLTVAFGRHAVKGHLCWSSVTGAAPNHQITAYNALGEGEWQSCDAAYYRGIYLPPADVHFHSGALAASMADTDSYFLRDVPHSRTAAIGYKCPVGIGDADTEKNPPLDFEGLFRTKKCPNFNSAGLQTDFSYTANPARCVVEALISYARLPNLPGSYSNAAAYWLTRIDWGAWTAWRDYCAAAETVNYYQNNDFDGFGLRASYYNGANFETFVSSFVQPVIDINPGSASPSAGVAADNFSARFEGKIRAKVSGAVTFSLYHDDGVRLWVGGSLLIDFWAPSNTTHSASFTMVEGQVYDIRIDWQETGGLAQLRLEWSGPGLAQEVVSSKYLYPPEEQRPRYESHVYFDTKTNFADVIRTILFISNSVMQDVNGKLRFYCLEQLTPGFAFTDANIDILTFRRRDILQSDPITSYEAKFRDLDSEFLEEPATPIHIDLDYFTRKNYENVRVVELYNTTRWQARKVLLTRARLETGNDLMAEIEARTALTYPVVAGDVVTLQHRKIGAAPRNYLVREATDGGVEESAGGQGTEPETRTFTLQEWP